jgi:hypothetical protein
MDERTPDQGNETSTGLEHSIHLADGLAPIGEVLQAKLTEDDIKKRLRKGQRSSVSFPWRPVGVAGNGPPQACLG